MFRRRFRSKILTVLVVSTVGGMCLSKTSISQSANTASNAPPKLDLGPYVRNTNLAGINIRVNTTATLESAVREEGTDLMLTLRADFHDLQVKFGQIVDTIPLRRDNCASYKPDNFVFSLSQRILTVSGDTAAAHIEGQVVVWTCLQNPIPNSRLDWEIRRIGPIRTKVPVVRTWPGNPIKTILLTQPFEVTLPIVLARQDDRSAQVEFGAIDVRLGGQYAAVTEAILKILKIDLGQKLQQKLADLNKTATLSYQLPQEFGRFGVKLISANLLSEMGVLIAEFKASTHIARGDFPIFTQIITQPPRR